MTDYSYTQLSGPGNAVSVVVNAIGAAGEVIGNYTESNTSELGFIYSDGTYTSLAGPAGGTQIDPTAINASGEVAGDYTDGSQFGFIYSDGTYTTLSGPDGASSLSISAISSSGDVTGSTYLNGTQVGYIYDGTNYTVLDPNGATLVETFAINASEDVVGYYQASDGTGHDFIYDHASGDYTTLSGPAGTHGANINGINDSGEVIGVAYDNSGSQVAFTYSGGNYTILSGPAGALFVSPTAINASGEVVGTYYDLASGNVLSFVYDNGVYTTLSVPPSNYGTDAVAIDNSGDVAGNYTTDTSGDTQGFVASQPLCYLRGTRILTPTGEVAIEDIRIGDPVITRFGGIRPVLWIGRQSYDARFGGEKRDQRPIHIRPGALGDRMPARDLYVSPGHSMLVDGHLILAKFLVNGITITQDLDEDRERIEYFMLDLGTHDCVIAEGTWSESFADGPGLRDQFHNVAEFRALYPDEPPVEEIALCAPRPEHGTKLDTVLCQVMARAAKGLVPGPLRLEDRRLGR
jgi:hypothetical protein